MNKVAHILVDIFQTGMQSWEINDAFEGAWATLFKLVCQDSRNGNLFCVSLICINFGDIGQNTQKVLYTHKKVIINNFF